MMLYYSFMGSTSPPEIKEKIMPRTPNQVLASTLRRREYSGCTGQTSSHGAGKHSIQIFAPATEKNTKRFPAALKNQQGTLVVADFEL